MHALHIALIERYSFSLLVSETTIIRVSFAMSAVGS